jgi:hypothetical protein
MTWLELYNAVCTRIWGVQTPPEGAVELLQGQYGVIATVHRNIQKNRNYWFMETSTTLAVVAGTTVYDLPDDFKEFVRDGLRFINSDTGYYESPLKCLYPGDENYFNDPTATDDYPKYYEIYGGQLVLTLVPKSDQTLYMRYYKYLDRPHSTFDDTDDELTINGNDAIYNLAAAEVLNASEEFQKAQIYDGKGQQALMLLAEEDMSRRRATLTQIRYEDV